MSLVGGFLERNCKKRFECKDVYEQLYLTQITIRQGKPPLQSQTRHTQSMTTTFMAGAQTPEKMTTLLMQLP